MKQYNLVVLLSFLLLSYYFNRLADGITISDDKNVMCIDHERDALLKFKQDIEVDRCGLLNSWGDDKGNQNCCQWSGVRCSNYTGHVVMLSLRGGGDLDFYDLNESCLQGKVSSSLVDLKHLSYLDLSYNELEGSLPSAFGNMHALSYLDLSFNKLEGPISDTISNIKSLTHLYLSQNYFQSLPKTLGNLCSLQELDLSYSHLTDELPNIIQTLTGCASKSLSSLLLMGNQIWGPVPDSLGTFPSLRELYLDENRLNGTITENLGKLSNLETSDLSSNFLNGTLTKNHFSNLSRLNYLDLSNNKALVFDIDEDWVPPFNLDRILLSSYRLGPLFPNWLLSQTNYSYLDISVAGISDSIPESFWKSLSSNVYYLNMSHNSIHGTLLTIHTHLYNDLDNTIDMSFNNINGAVPSFLSNFSELHLNDNKFSNPIPFLCQESNLNIELLDLSNNMLSGELPDCWMNFNQLSNLHLNNNNFLGSIPPSIGYLKQLESLHLRNNSFSGKLPRSLENLKSLVILDLGHNLLSGHVPSSIGRNLTYLSFLSLRSNSFVAEMPLSLCQMSSLKILDLSDNHITGTFPKCINNLTAMKDEPDSIVTDFFDTAIVMWKRKEWSFGNSLGLVKAIDISKNKLEGEIPTEISELRGLVSLDLSRNNLVGSITPKIGQLTALQVLDLSNNHLSGEIPASLADLNFLGILDLSYNHLSGKIPYGPLLQGFEASAYMGNPELCGMPLQECPWDQPPNNNPVNNDDITLHNENRTEDVFPGLYISVVLGFIIGFWGVCGTLVLKRSWRHAFFRFFDDVKDKLYIMVFVKITKVIVRRL